MATVTPDQALRELVGIYERAARQIDVLARRALARGAIGTAAYRQQQLASIAIVLGRLRTEGAQAALNATTISYLAGMTAVDQVTGVDVAGAFTSVHQRAIAQLAVNMSRPLAAAATQLGTNVQRTFALADRIDGALGPDTLAGFLGRRVDDESRRQALRTIAEHIAHGSTRRDASNVLRGRLERAARAGTTEALQLVRDELTGEARAAFIDRAGRRWELDVYTRMVARTTTAEAATAGTIGRLRDNDMDLVTISDHGTQTPLCQEFEGHTYSISGRDNRYPRLRLYPPFHPGCQHYVMPAETTFEDFERALAAGVDPAAAQ